MFTRFWIGTVVIITLGLAAAQSSGSPTLGKLMEGSQRVYGQAASGSGPIVIYDISFPARTRLGATDAVGSDGSFSSPVKPALVKGHQIIAVDRNGNASAAVTVEASSGPAPAPQ